MALIQREQKSLHTSAQASKNRFQTWTTWQTKHQNSLKDRNSEILLYLNLAKLL